MTMLPGKLKAIEERLNEVLDAPNLQRLSDVLVLHVEPESLVATMTTLRDDEFLDFKLLSDLCGVHWPQRDKPFEVVYQLLSVYRNHRLRVKVGLAEGQALDTVIPVWSSANWFEREVYDMFGVRFIGHPDLRRILMDYDFHGHPLRKDFPLVGEYQVRFDAKSYRVIREPVQLARPRREAYGRNEP
ncbi:MAG: NADH-quinone oxidoreductase subunit C [Magnetococcus sp. WYHC-3]